MSLTNKSQVTKIEVKSEINNHFSKAREVIDQLKTFIYIQLVLGINRTYVVKSGRFISWTSRIYEIILILLTILLMFTAKITSTSYMVVHYISCIELILLIVNAMFFKKQTFVYLIENMDMFDDILNIKKEMNTKVNAMRAVVWMGLCSLYSVVEYCILINLVDWTDILNIVLNMASILAHESELILFFGFIRMILGRVQVMKAHIKKIFGKNDGGDLSQVNGEIFSISNNSDLNTITTHRTYELLHKCAEQLNSILSFPMMVTLFCSGVITIMLLRTVFMGIQDIEMDRSTKLAFYAFCAIRCIRYTVMVIVPCYYSTVTTANVSKIRNMLHDAVNSGRLDKVEKRRVKAFFQLTREKQFAYALWGVIRLNMSLPLSYCSLCTTYLVIIIQFSKFID